MSPEAKGVEKLRGIVEKLFGSKSILKPPLNQKATAEDLMRQGCDQYFTKKEDTVNQDKTQDPEWD